jgi:D-serine deaminase-like pyridoxal phosphate-dependent protein
MEQAMRLDDLETPFVAIDEAVLDANIARAQTVVDSAGITFRPHIKTHKLPFVAQKQIAAGASGINCQKLSEAEVFADAGFDDILITFNMIGASRLVRLATLNARVKLTVTADSPEVVGGLGAAFDAANPLAVLVECDTGAGRCGVQTAQAAFALAQEITAMPSLRFHGLLTYPLPNFETRVQAFFAATLALLEQAAVPCPIRSTGGTPSLFNAALVPLATEYRAGTYVYNDRKILSSGAIEVTDCAMQIWATVVSRATENRAILDAGSKTLSSDLLGLSGYGLLPDYPNATIDGLSEEHGHVDLSHCSKRPTIGERVRVIPNHTCVVTNLAETVVFHRDGAVTQILPVAARGRVW